MAEDMTPEPSADPTPDDLNDPVFEAIWQAIKRWDVSPTSNGLYSGATGTDVMVILRAVRPYVIPLADRERALELATNGSCGCDDCRSRDAEARRLLRLPPQSGG